MISISFIRTYYPHWGEHSGIHQFIRHLDTDLFNISVKAVPMDDEGYGVWPLDEYLRNKIEKRGVPAYLFSDLKAEVSTFAASFLNRYDFIHLLDAEHSLMFLPRWVKRFGMIRSFPKIIAMFHQPPSQLESLINIDIVKQVDYVLVVSPIQVSYFEQYLPSERIKMILHGIDTDYFVPNQHKASSETFKCLAAGIWLRDYDAVMETARLLKGHPQIEFHVIASELEIPSDVKNVHVHKNISDEEMLELYQNSNVLLMPLEAGTANNVLLEGAACGLPVITTDMISTRAYLPGKEAVLIKDNDPKAFAEILLDLYHNSDKHKAMSTSARKRALELSWPNIARQYEQMYLGL